MQYKFWQNIIRFITGSGSILGPLLYTVYVAPIGRLIHNLGVNYHQCADDTQLYTKLEVPVTASLATPQQCVTALHAWFSQNGLLLNPDKSEIMYIGTRQRLRISELLCHRCWQHNSHD